jgi:hypothetical protein
MGVASSPCHAHALIWGNTKTGITEISSGKTRKYLLGNPPPWQQLPYAAAAGPGKYGREMQCLAKSAK